MGLMARSTFTFSSVMDWASIDEGGSMASMHTSCSRWFCTTSRRQPTVS